MTVPLASLILEQTEDEIYDGAIGVARGVNLPVDSWQAGDPTRSLYHVEAKYLAALEKIVVGFIKSGFLDYAKGMWLKVVADQMFGVTVPPATAASTDVVLTNAGSGVYDIDAGDLTLKNSATGKTYHNTTGGHLAASGTLTVTVEADETGSASSAGATEIDTFVTTLLGVTCSNPTAAVGVDEQDEAVTRQQCRDKLGSLSPNGPKDAYSYVARNSTLTGTSEPTRTRVYADSDTGDVTLYVAGASGAVSGPALALVTTAIGKYATPLCVTATVLSASSVTVDVTYELWIYKSCNKTSDEVKADIETALEQMFATRPIGGDIIPPDIGGKLYKSMVESTIRSVFAQAFRVSVSAPSGDTDLANGDVAALGTVTGTVNIVTDP